MIQQMDGIILAGMRGRVVAITRRGGVIIETRAAIIQGTIGVGNQVAGMLTFWNSNSPFQPTAAAPSLPMTPPTILVVPGPLNFAMLRQAMNMGIAGIVASSVSSRDLEGFLGTDLIALINSMDIELAYKSFATSYLATYRRTWHSCHASSHYQSAQSVPGINGSSLRNDLYPSIDLS